MSLADGLAWEKEYDRMIAEYRTDIGYGSELPLSNDMVEMEKATAELKKINDNVSKIISGQGEMQVTEFGAKRESNEGRGRFDLLPYEAMEALAKWYEAGAGKYGDRNWERGISVKDCVNRMIRHAIKAGSGWTDEDHLAAVMWNAATAITMMQRRPDCNDHVWRETRNPNDHILDDPKWHVDDCEKNESNANYGNWISKACDDCFYNHGLCTHPGACCRDKSDINYNNGYTKKGNK